MYLAAHHHTALPSSVKIMKYVLLQVVLWDQQEKNDIVTTFQPLEQQKNDNKKYNGMGFLPDYEGYIS